MIISLLFDIYFWMSLALDVDAGLISIDLEKAFD